MENFMTENTNRCLVCEQTSHQIPLLAIDYQGKQYWICPQHLPLLIHKPHELIGKLPGADQFKPYE